MPRQTAEPHQQQYEATGMVLESREHGPELCLGPHTLIYPPRARGIPIINWRWDEVVGQESFRDRTWGTYHLTGSYDGSSFTVTRVRQPVPRQRKQVDFSSPCAEPPGGWPVPDPSRASLHDVDPVARLAGSKPDFAGLWIAPLDPWDREFILNVAFTGDLGRREAELRAVWGGRLCVTRYERSLAELRRIHDQARVVTEELGLKVFVSGVDEVDNTVFLEVLVVDDHARAAIDQRYAGVVRLRAALTPVGGPVS